MNAGISYWVKVTLGTNSLGQGIWAAGSNRYFKADVVLKKCRSEDHIHPSHHVTLLDHMTRRHCCLDSHAVASRESLDLSRLMRMISQREVTCFNKV